ncbi:hypothetical protein BGZ96_011057 [Linnemannia gamsii]|uniref:Uncharacterized protein n=1 Tax=Linnemannia gamsii TaxID=64522 RepID=A0ABQ7JSY6_9FUNG|nr:hypothetical protein BGZ96_011057 [Linnemannia gamsii]
MAKAKQALSRRTGHTGLSTSEPVPVLCQCCASVGEPSSSSLNGEALDAEERAQDEECDATTTLGPSNTGMAAMKRKRKRTGSTLDLNLDDHNNNSTHSAATASQKKRRRTALIDNDSSDDDSDNSNHSDEGNSNDSDEDNSNDSDEDNSNDSDEDNSNDSDEDNSDNSNSYSDDSDVWESRPLSARARVEVARMAKSAGNLSDLHKPKGPGKAKQPYYRMAPAQKLQHR